MTVNYYSSSFGGLLIPEIPISDYDPSFSYLLLNTEFENDTQLTGFQINASGNGTVNLTVNKTFI